MLKTRLIPCLLLKNGLLVRSQDFKLHQVLGDPIHQVERFNAWHVDELIYLDITREGAYDMRRDDMRVKDKATLLDIIDAVSRTCFMPLTFGGGIRSVEEARLRLAHGADKVTLNTGAVERRGLVTECAEAFGSQAVVASIDVRELGERRWEVFTHAAKEATGLDAVEWAREVAALGAGEIFLNSIDRDGRAQGYDLPLIEAVSSATTIPVIACGGVGRWEHLTEGVEAGASAVSAANIFHFTEHSTRMAKEALAAAGVDVRLPRSTARLR